MSDEEKFSPDKQGEKSNLVGKIAATLLFALMGGGFIFAIYVVHHSAMVPLFVLLATSFVIASIWLDGLYIYRYMLPAIIIILIFTAYPIVYTVAIAFTNFGTGHLLSAKDVKEDLLTKQWEVNDEAGRYFVEVYVPDEALDNFVATYNKDYNEFYDSEDIEEMDEDESDAIWLEKEDALLKAYLKEADESKYKLVVYSDTDITTPVLAESEAEMGMTDVTDDGGVKVYLGEYNASNEQYDTRKVELGQISEITKGYRLINDRIYFPNPELEEEIDEDAYIIASDILGFLTGFTEKLSLYTPLMIDGKTYRLEMGNEFVNKEHSFLEVDDQLFIKNGNTNEPYSTKIYKSAKEGAYVATLDNEKPKYWHEYSISQFEFKYGAFTISTNSEAEDFLENLLVSESKMQKLNISDSENILNKEVKSVSSADLQVVKNEIKEANAVVKEINSNIKQYKKQFLEKIKSEIAVLNQPLLDVIASNKKEIITLKKEIKVLKKKNKTYATHLQIKDKRIEIDELYKELRAFTRQYKARNQQAKRVIFPTIAPFKIETIRKSNVDYSIAVEPGYASSVGFNNFKRIVSSKSITAPFFRVFVWTIAWASLATISTFIVGLFLAMVFNAGDFKGKYFYRTIFILPYAIPAFVTVLMWGGLLNDDFGVINLAFDVKVPWLMDPRGWFPKFSVLLVNLWLGFPYMMLISLGALQSIDASMYEAAEVDGANTIQKFFLITLPLLLLALGPMLVGTFAFAFNNFGAIYLLTQGRPVMAGGVLPGHTDILISYTYKLAFGQNETDYGLASAIAIIVFLIIGSITFFNFKFTGTFKEVDNA